MLLIGSLGLISCTTAQTVTPENPYTRILLNMIPESPAVPEFPSLEWTLGNEKYCITESDADKLLDYGENKLPLFRFQYDQYTKQVLLILEALENP